VRIPRCRATVSEEIAAGHWELASWEGRRRTSDRRCPNAVNYPDSLSQENGANRHHTNLSRDKGEVYAVLSGSRFPRRSAGGSFRH